MSARARVARLERGAAARDGTDLARHWRRVNDERLADLEDLMAGVPRSHEARVLEHLPRIGERLFVAGPAWGRDDDPAFVRWVLQRAGWGRDHPYNPPLPDPLPAALLDLFLDHPGAGVGYCPHCRAALPFVPASGALGVPYRPGMRVVRACPIAATCPVCGGDTPPRAPAKTAAPFPPSRA